MLPSVPARAARLAPLVAPAGATSSVVTVRAASRYLATSAVVRAERV